MTHQFNTTPITQVIVRLFALIAILAPSSGLQFAAETTVFGPQNYDRQSGNPVTVLKTFSVTNPDSTFVLNVYNGGLDDDNVIGEYVSSSTIKINGIVVVGPSNFNKNGNYSPPQHIKK